MASRLSTLSPSLMLDLMRFEQDGQQSGVIEVLAACIRHARKLLIHLQATDRVVPLTVFPVEHLVHCPMPMAQFLALPLGELSVLHVEPALLRPPGDRVQAMVGEPQHYSALGPVLWELALRGPRARAAARDRRPGGLPHLAGAEPARARPQRLDGRGGGPAASATPATCARWRSGPASTASARCACSTALYLQAGLMVSRTHPAATNEGWTGGRSQ